MRNSLGLKRVIFEDSERIPHRRSQGREPRVSSIQEYLSAKSHRVPEGLQKFCTGHAGESMTDLYAKIKKDESSARSGLKSAVSALSSPQLYRKSRQMTSWK